MDYKSMDEYLRSPYTVEVTRDTIDGYTAYFARVVELPGCMTQADSFDELEEMLQEAMQIWIETSMEMGRPIPEPNTANEYSGKFVVRLPKSLHRELVESAEREGVSLNALVNVALSKYVGMKSEA